MKEKTGKKTSVKKKQYSVINQVRTQHSILYLVCDVLLLCRGVTFGVNESGVSHQVASVLHDEAPGT